MSVDDCFGIKQPRWIGLASSAFISNRSPDRGYNGYTDGHRECSAIGGISAEICGF